MIPKITQGNYFRGLQKYLLGPSEDGRERVAWTELRNLGCRQENAAHVMHATSQLGHGAVKEPVYHLSISLAHGESLSKDQWSSVIDRFLARLGMEGHQALVVAHNDKPHQHVHVMVNRVHPDTLKAARIWRDQVICSQVANELEKELGLRVLTSRERRDALEPEESQRTAGEEKAMAHGNKDYPTIGIADRARPILQSTLHSWADLESRLQDEGLTLEIHGAGLVIREIGKPHRVAISRIHRPASSGRLAQRFGQTYKQWKDREREVREAAACLTKPRQQTGKSAHRHPKNLRSKKKSQRARNQRQSPTAIARANNILNVLNAVGRPFGPIPWLPRQARLLLAAARSLHLISRILEPPSSPLPVLQADAKVQERLEATLLERLGPNPEPQLLRQLQQVRQQKADLAREISAVRFATEHKARHAARAQQASRQLGSLAATYFLPRSAKHVLRLIKIPHHAIHFSRQSPSGARSPPGTQGRNVKGSIDPQDPSR